jgi:His-Xaa-Ser system protein HxsD
MLGPEADAVAAPEDILPKGAAYRFQDGSLRLSLATELYSLDAIRRSCYWLTDRCYVFLSRSRTDTVEVTLIAKGSGAPAESTNSLAWMFLNDLIDQQLRVDIGNETAGIRELIVAQAFAEADVIDHSGRPVEINVSSDEPPVDRWKPVP